MNTDTQQESSDTSEEVSDNATEENVDATNEETSNETSADNDSTAKELPNALAMSDEEIMAMDGPNDLENKPAAEEKTEADSTSSPEFGSESDTETKSDAEQNPEADTDTETKSDSESTEKDTESERDIAAEHAQLFAPLKAGKQTIEIKSVDEAISLMQKGADYHRKTEELSGHRRTIKTLEKAGIKPDDLNYLIDLHNKNPQAIAKLLADGKIDPFELDTESDEAKNYQPEQHTISEASLALDDALADLKAKSAHYDDVVDVVGSKWDDESRNTVATSPHLLKVLSEHMRIGYYPIIDAELTRQKAFGNLKGLSDMAAYQQVGDAIEAQGGFAHLSTNAQEGQTAQMGTTTKQKFAVRPAQDSSDPNLDAKRRAASPTKAASPNKRTNLNTVNPLSLDDATFEKQFSASLQ